MNDSVNMKITPAAMLAAVLFNADKSRKVRVQAADSAEQIDTEEPIVKIQHIDDAVVCSLPMERVLHFALQPYSLQFQVVRGVSADGTTTTEEIAIMTFEKQPEASILTAGGKPAIPSSSVMQKALEGLKFVK